MIQRSLDSTEKEGFEKQGRKHWGWSSWGLTI